MLCSVNKEQLEGYCCAYGTVTAASLASTGLLARMELSKKHAFSVGVDVLSLCCMVQLQSKIIAALMIGNINHYLHLHG